MAVIPPEATAAANTPLVPLLARREVLVRFPFTTDYLDRDRTAHPVDWIAVDLDLLERYSVAFRGDWRQLRNSRRWISDHRESYAVQALSDGVVVLERHGQRQPDLETALDQHLARNMPTNPGDL